MLTPQHRQELLSRAYVAAVAASVGMTFSTRDFDYGIDLTLHEVTNRKSTITGKRRLVESGRTLDIQIKSTTSAIMESDQIAYDLDVNSYDDLRDLRVRTPRILVLHVQPHEESDRVQQSERELKLGGCCYWMSLKGREPTVNTATTRIKIPCSQVFSAVQLAQMMARISQGVPL